MGRILFTVLVTIVFWYIVLTSAETYYVTPSPNMPCPEEGVPCFTLSEYANKSNIANYFASNTTLIFLPGNHIFDSKLSSRNISTLSIESNSSSHSDTSITCDESARFTFESISVVSMRGLALFGCVNNEVTKVEELRVEDCSFDGQGRNGTGLHLVNVSTATIMRSSFFSYTGREIGVTYLGGIIQAGGAIIVFNTKLYIIISDCIFQNNTVTVSRKCAGYGGAVYAELSYNFNIVNSKLNSNAVTSVGEFATVRGGAVYVSSSPNINILNTTLNNNIVTGTGESSVIGGAVCFISSPNITILGSSLNSNTMNGEKYMGYGGAVYAGDCTNISIVSSTLSSNTMTLIGEIGNVGIGHGGALGVQDSHNITIVNSTLNNNTVTGIQSVNHGGAVYVDSSSKITIINSFLKNNAVTAGGKYGYAWGGSVVVDSCPNVTIVNCTLNNNSVMMSNRGYGGSLRASASPNITILNSTFSSNTVSGSEDGYGGAVSADSCPNITIVNSTLNNNNIVSGDKGGAGGAIYATSCPKFTIVNSTLNNNSVTSPGVGGAVYADNSSVSIYNYSAFRKNSTSCIGSSCGPVFYFINTIFNSSGFLHIQTNMADTSVILYGLQSSLYFSGNTTLASNNGSLFVYSCNVTFMGHTSIVNNSFQSSDNIIFDGGVLTAYQSKMVFMDRVNLEYNRGMQGGAIAAIHSKLYFYGETIISHNTASISGGGLYAYQSELNFMNHMNISRNTAKKNGGGIHAISSRIGLTNNRGKIDYYIIGNYAERGGGLCLEGSAKIYIQKLLWEAVSSKNLNIMALHLDYNTADYGGAVYIADNTTSATCYATPAISDECFIQGIMLYNEIQVSLNNDKANTNTLNTYFTNNRAIIYGNVFYGGLLDRCRASPFAEILFRNNTLTPTSLSAVSYLLNITDLTTEDFKSTKMISSDPVRVCFCKKNQPDCSYHPQPKHVRKGEIFTVSLVAVDHINNSIGDSTVHAYIQGAKLGEGQSNQNTSWDGNCTNMNYSIFSLHNFEKLHFYADGPCMHVGISKASFTVVIEPCPIGFQDKNERCECDSRLTLQAEYVSNCSIDKETVQRKDNSWFSYINTTDRQGYMLHKYCPFDYCKPSTENVSVNLNTEYGVNELCAFNRSGKLCGTCEDGLSLSLGNSHCRPCSNNWLALLIVFALAGVALVAIILKLNLTIAEGTFNGLIFYANIFVANRAIFFPRDKTKILTVFIAWLNLDLGIETCFYDGMDAYFKTWLQFAFPFYVISLVVAIIIISENSTKFARLVTAGKNPIATLATLILLSYTKLLRAIINSLSVTKLQYSPLRPDNGSDSYDLVWLVDANIPYLRGKHIPLFITALTIAIVLLGFTLMLFAWQWLVHCPNRGPLRWIIGNTKVISMIDAYHNPYNKNHRYWIGLQLFGRVVLYLISAVNVLGDPKVNLLSIILAIAVIWSLKQIVESKRKVNGMEIEKSLKSHSMSDMQVNKMIITLLIRKVHKRQHVEVLEAISLLNLLVLASATFITEDKNSQNVIAYISTSVAFITFLALLGHHMYKFVLTELFYKFGSKFHTQTRSHPPLPVNNTVSAALSHTEGSRAETETEVNASPENLLTKTLEDEVQKLTMTKGEASAQTSRVRKRLSLTKSSSSCLESQDTSIEIEVPNLASGRRPSLLSPSALVGMSLREEEGSSESEDEYTPLLKQK